MKMFRQEKSWVLAQQRMVSLGTYLGRPMVQVNTEGDTVGRILKSNLRTMYYISDVCILNFEAIVSCVQIPEFSNGRDGRLEWNKGSFPPKF
jgi:hypothetical protein